MPGAAMARPRRSIGTRRGGSLERDKVADSTDAGAVGFHVVYGLSVAAAYAAIDR